MTEALRPLVFQILLLLNEEECHGYAIMQEINERAGRRVILGPATLYRTLGQMRDEDLIAEVNSDDDRRRVYSLTAHGRDVARAEALRMASLVDRARSGQLLR